MQWAPVTALNVERKLRRKFSHSRLRGNPVSGGWIKVWKTTHAWEQLAACLLGVPAVSLFLRLAL
jgi:hypothetical protein